MKKLLCSLLLFLFLFTSCSTETEKPSSPAEPSAQTSNSFEWVKITYLNKDFYAYATAPKYYEFTTHNPEVIRQLEEYRLSDSMRPARPGEMDGLCSYWVTYPDGHVVGVFDDLDYGNVGTEIKPFGNDRILPAGMSDFVGELVSTHIAQISSAAGPSDPPPSSFEWVKITYDNEEFFTNGTLPEQYEFTIHDPDILRQLAEYRLSGVMRPARSDELLEGMCSFWVTYPDGHIIGIYESCDYGNVDTKIEPYGNDTILPPGMSAFVGKLVKADMED